MKQSATALRRSLVILMSCATFLVGALVVSSTTADGSKALAGIENTLVRTLHVAGLFTDAHAGGGLASTGGGTASTASGVGFTEPATVQIGSSAKLIARVVVALPVTVTCALLPGGNVAFGGVFAQVFQAQGRSVLAGFGFASVPANACDNNPHVYTVDVFPESTASGTSGVFHGGPAAASANAFACDTFSDCASGSAGVQEVLISG